MIFEKIIKEVRSSGPISLYTC